MYTTGIPTCDQLREVAFTGNVIPQNWYRIFVKSDLKHPKPHLLAINILADIVYWYRPREIRDEGSGQIIGYQKKFRDDLLQRSYAQIAEQFGCSAGQAKGVPNATIKRHGLCQCPLSRARCGAPEIAYLPMW